MPNIYAYVRVSTQDQNTDRQLISMEQAGVPRKHIYTDKCSGKDFQRPQYIKLMRRLRSGDTLYIKSIDRLGRNYEEIIREWQKIVKELKADIVVLDMPLLDTRRDKNLLGTFISDIVLQLLSFVAENERINLRERQAEGIAAAKKRGVKFGRPAKPIPENFDKLVLRWDRHEVTIAEIVRTYGISESTFYRRLREFRASRRMKK